MLIGWHRFPKAAIPSHVIVFPTKLSVLLVSCPCFLSIVQGT
ncbi:hypothetical protein SAMN03159444_03256 [Pseudomonas sp. NFACC02]|nr:hypothetical protein SAMN03159444_03256 [Pseudomonas sp. NFACC02]